MRYVAARHPQQLLQWTILVKKQLCTEVEIAILETSLGGLKALFE